MKRTGDLNFAIEKNFREAGIEIASPRRDIWYPRGSVAKPNELLRTSFAFSKWKGSVTAQKTALTPPVNPLADSRNEISALQAQVAFYSKLGGRKEHSLMDSLAALPSPE
jgi:hypothetical protein